MPSADQRLACTVTGSLNLPPFHDFCGLPLISSLRKRLSVSESSHTESDSSPPLTVRRRCCSAIIEMPRFAISSEEEAGQGNIQDTKPL